jgi:2,3,4,5-tetrahydropyridine-2-carboxylate N-succinyltransferase
MEIIETKEDFKTLVQDIKESTPNYINPLAFGICKVISDKADKQKTLKALYLMANCNENFASAAIFIKSLNKQGVEVDFNESEVVCDINISFLNACVKAFAPYVSEAYGDSHKNIQTIMALYKQIIDTGSLDAKYKITFIFKEESLQSIEATSLKLSCINQDKG